MASQVLEIFTDKAKNGTPRDKLSNIEEYCRNTGNRLFDEIINARAQGKAYNDGVFEYNIVESKQYGDTVYQNRARFRRQSKQAEGLAQNTLDNTQFEEIKKELENIKNKVDNVNDTVWEMAKAIAKTLADNGIGGFKKASTFEHDDTPQQLNTDDNRTVVNERVLSQGSGITVSESETEPAGAVKYDDV